MLAIIENKWDTKCIKILPAQQKVLWKRSSLLRKAFITKKFTQCKTSRIIKIEVFEIPNNKNIGKLFSKYELVFLHQANSSFDPSKILMLQFPTPRASLPASPSLLNITLANCNPFSTQSSPCSSLVFVFCPTPFDHTPPQVLDIYTYHNTLWVKHATHQKAESLRAASLSKLDNKVNKYLIENTLNSLQHGRCSFIFTTLLVHTTTHTISTKSPFLFFSLFSTPYSTITCSQNYSYNPH